jgi:hypothetical protein
VALRGGKPVFVKQDQVLEAAQRETEQMLDRTRLRALTREPASIWRATRYQTGKD